MFLPAEEAGKAQPPVQPTDVKTGEEGSTTKTDSEVEDEAELEGLHRAAPSRTMGGDVGGGGAVVAASLGVENVDFVADMQPVEETTQPASPQLPEAAPQVCSASSAD